MSVNNRGLYPELGYACSGSPLWRLTVSVVLSLALSLALLGCSQPTSNSVTVVASIRPLALLLAELTAGLPIEVTTLLPEGATPHEFSLKPSDLRALEQAQLVVWVGASAEPYLARIADRPASIAFDAQAGVRQLPWFGPKPAEAAEHDDEPDHDHDHGRYDPHLWLSESNVRALLPVVSARLIALEPEWEATLAANAAALTQRLQQGLAASQSTLAEAASRRQRAPGIAVLHDAYRYLATDLNLAVVSVVVQDHGVTPGIRHLARLKSRFSVEPPACLVIDPNESGRLLDKVLPPQGLSQVMLDPMGWQGTGTDQSFSEWLNANYQALAACVLKGLDTDVASAGSE